MVNTGLNPILDLKRKGTLIGQRGMPDRNLTQLEAVALEKEE